MRRTVAAIVLLAAVSLRGEILNVTRADDDRLPGSLRWAIEQSNALPGGDEIRITGPLTIQPKSALPPLRDTVLLIGLATHEVAIDGVDAGVANGIAGLAPGVMIHGIRVIRFNGAGLEVYGDRSVVSDCIVRDNAGDGIVAGSGAWVSNNRIDANRNGIRVEGPGAVVVANTIGFEAGNRENGIWVTASASKALIGEMPSSAGIGSMIPHTNWIYRSGAHGVLVDGTQIIVGGNVIGARGKGNALHGIFSRGNARIAANDTSFNGRAGIAFMKSGSVETIYGCCNGGLLLDIGADGPTPNDPGDLDDVPNAPRILWGLESARRG
jgi:hypothetical protein